METEYTKGFRAGIAFEQERLGKLLDEYIMNCSEPNREMVRRRFAFVRGLINDKDAWLEGKNNE